jgi:hypothetical protein
MQTAVEWLAEQFDSIVELYPSQFEKINNAITQAKEMEKQQIIEFADKYDAYVVQGGTLTAERYCNKTFKQN